jgi:hypothetical protein
MDTRPPEAPLLPIVAFGVRTSSAASKAFPHSPAWNPAATQGIACAGERPMGLPRNDIMILGRWFSDAQVLQYESGQGPSTQPPGLDRTPETRDQHGNIRRFNKCRFRHFLTTHPTIRIWHFLLALAFNKVGTDAGEGKSLLG